MTTVPQLPGMKQGLARLCDIVPTVASPAQRLEGEMQQDLVAGADGDPCRKWDTGPVRLSPATRFNPRPPRCYDVRVT